MWKAGNELLLDTSAVIESWRKNPEVVTTLTATSGLLLPVIVYGELLLGAEKSQHPERKFKEITTFLKAVSLLDIDRSTAKHYSKLRTALERQGTPIPENDLWIASLAVQYGLYVYTVDKHFQLISGLKLFLISK